MVLEINNYIDSIFRKCVRKGIPEVYNENLTRDTRKNNEVETRRKMELSIFLFFQLKFNYF